MKEEITAPKEHWNRAYLGRKTEELGWYEEDPQPSLDLIEGLGLTKDARQLHVGVGASSLIDHLLEKGYSSLIATDISAEALNRLKSRLGSFQEKVEWLIDDLVHARKLQSLEPVQLWHDRAVLHFFVEESDRASYVQLMKKVIAPGGFAIIATFSMEGAHLCSGLPVQRYDAPALEELIGDEFRMVKSFDYTFKNPRDEDRPYVYTLFQRVNN
jgi:EEF1A lysine methyltransferase 2